MPLPRTPSRASPALRGGAIDTWLRRDLGETALGAGVEEAVRARPAGEFEHRADALLVLHAVALLDPLAPLCWRGLALWPDGLGPALAAERQDGETSETLREIIAADLAIRWTKVRGRGDVARATTEARQRRAVLRDGGARRLAYALNPLLACDSKLLGGRIVVEMADLVPALETQTGRLAPGTPAIDAEIAALIAARSEQPVHATLAALALGDGGPVTARAALAQLELFAALQRGRAAPALARCLVAAPDLLAGWQGAAKRRELAAHLTALAQAGDLAPILATVADPAGRAADQLEAGAGAATLARLDAELVRIETGGSARATAARGLGQEAAAGLALAALALSITLRLFG
jgi:eukaryotic-like serine/threonine-protein kinase